MVKANELARVKTSGEDVFVLKVGGDSALVRRPTGTQDGIKHLTEEFLLAELETPDEARTRAMAEQFAMQKKFAALNPDEPPAEV